MRWHFSDTFDTKYTNEESSDTDSNLYRHAVAMSTNLSVLIKYDFLATMNPK